jgi:hypothetical protein
VSSPQVGQLGLLIVKSADGTFSGTIGTPANGLPKTSYFSVYYLASDGSYQSSLTASLEPGAGANSAATPVDFSVTIPYCDQSPAYQYNFLPATGKNASLIVAGSGSARIQKLYANSIIDYKTPPPSPFEDYINAGVNDPIPAHGPINDAGGAILSGAAAHSFSQNTSDAQRLLLRTQFQPNFARLACSYAYLTGTLPTDDNSPILDFSGNPESIATSPSGNPYTLTGPLAPQFYLFDIVRWSDATPAQTAQSGATTLPPMYQATTDEWYLLDYSDKTDKHRDLLGSLQKLPAFDTGTAMRIISTSRVLFVAIHLAPPAKVSGALPSTSPGISIIPTEQAWFDNTSIKYKLNASTVDPVNVADLKTLITTVLGVTAPAAAAQVKPAPPGPISVDPSALVFPPTPFHLTATALSTTLLNKGANPLTGITIGISGADAADFHEGDTCGGSLGATANCTISVTFTPGSVATFSATLSIAYSSGGNVGQLDVALTGSGTPALSAAASNASTSLSPSQMTSINSFIGTLGDANEEVNAFCSGPGAAKTQNSIDCMMVDSAGQLNTVAATTLTASTGYAEADCKTLVSSLSGKTDMAALIANQITLRDCFYEALADSTDGKNAASLISSESTIASKLKDNFANSANVHRERPVVSLYQGLYNAALLTNLTQLPKGFTSAANITGTWTATFSGVKIPSSSQQQQGGAVQAPVGAAVPAPAPAAKAAPSALKGSNTTQQPAGSQQQTASQQAAPAANQQSASQPTSNSICALTTTTLGTGLTSQTTCTSTGPPTPGLHLEGIEWWDISVAVPVAGFKDVSFQQTTTSSGSTVNSAQPTAAVTRENAYGMFDMFVLGGADLYNPPSISYPYLSVGLPFAGKVFDKPYFAVGENVNIPSSLSKIPKIGQYLSNFVPIQIRPMFGWVANKEFETIAASGSTPAHKVYLRRSWDPQFSIEISIKSVASKLTKSSTSNNTKTTTTTGAANPASSGSGG